MKDTLKISYFNLWTFALLVMYVMIPSLSLSLSLCLSSDCYFLLSPSLSLLSPLSL